MCGMQEMFIVRLFTAPQFPFFAHLRDLNGFKRSTKFGLKLALLRYVLRRK